MDLLHLRTHVRADLERLVVRRSGQDTLRWRLEVLGKILLMPRVRGTLLVRLSQFVAAHRLTTLAYWIQARVLRACGMEISPFATIGPGLTVMHGSGIVVGPEVRIGRNLVVYQGVTLGDGSKPGQPIIGDDVILGAGCAVLGGVTVGDGAVVGAGAVVTRNVPSQSVAVGSTAEVRAKSERLRASSS